MGYQGRKQLKHSAEYVALKGCPLGRSSKGKDQVKLGAISYRWSSESTHVPLIFLPASFPVRLTTHTYARYIIVALEATDYAIRSPIENWRLSTVLVHALRGLDRVFPEFLQFSLSSNLSPSRRLLWLSREEPRFQIVPRATSSLKELAPRHCFII